VNPEGKRGRKGEGERGRRGESERVRKYGKDWLKQIFDIPVN